MPMPPDFANVLAYSSVRNERHTPPAPPPPNGPSPSMPVYIWLNIEERKADSKSTALARALASAVGLMLRDESAVSAAGPVCEASAGTVETGGKLPIEAITSPR